MIIEHAAQLDEFAMRYSDPSPLRVGQVLGTTLQLCKSGYCDGVVNYAIDPGGNDGVYPAVQQQTLNFQWATTQISLTATTTPTISTPTPTATQTLVRTDTPTPVPGATSTATARPAMSANGVPNFSHIFFLLMENHERLDVINNPSYPYINQLASTYAQGAQNHGVTHPSLGNYLAMISGDTQGVIDDCNSTDPACSFNVPSLPDQLEAAGKTWKGYMESMPSPCYEGGDALYDYSHNPFIYFRPIRDNTARCNSHVVNLDQLDTDLTAGTVPDFVFITPNLCHDTHNCAGGAGDTWLSGFLPRILNSQAYQQGGALFLFWDEGTTDANTIPFIVISPLGQRGFVSNVVENHYNTLRTVEDAWGLPPLGNAAGASSMSEYFTNAGLTPTATPTPTPTPNAASSPTATPTPTSVPASTATVTQTSTPSPVPASTPTDTPVPTSTVTATPTRTSTSVPALSPTPTMTAVPASTATATNTPIPVATATRTSTPVATSTSTATSTPGTGQSEFAVALAEGGTDIGGWTVPAPYTFGVNWDGSIGARPIAIVYAVATPGTVTGPTIINAGDQSASGGSLLLLTGSTLAFHGNAPVIHEHGVSGGSSVVFARPTAMQAGDLAIAYIDTPNTIVPPSGWTQRRHDGEGTVWTRSFATVPSSLGTWKTSGSYGWTHTQVAFGGSAQVVASGGGGAQTNSTVFTGTATH